MEITITIKVDGKEIFNQKIEHVEEKSVQNFSRYARFFDESSAKWEKDAEYNLMFLKQQQTYANDLLKSKGYLFLNEVYDLLGMPYTKEGQLVGWIYNEENTIGDNYVDFGIFNDNNRDFVNVYQRTILLDFNVDGFILDRL